MDCNKDEADRAMEFAVSEFLQRNFVKAKRYVLKAQQLFPTLEGPSQMLEVLNVHIIDENKLGGTETDWYGILQVDPDADESTIKRQYRRLALLLHPDKNKAEGAKAAFTKLDEAKGILSDKEKRALHDLKRAEVSKERLVMEPEVEQPFQKAFHASAANASQPRSSRTSRAFWTKCPKCNMQEQIQYNDYSIQCSHCEHQYVVREIHGTAIGKGAGGSRQHFEPHRHDIRYNKQPVSPAFNGATAATVQTDQKVRTESVGAEKAKRKETDEQQDKERDLKKARNAERDREGCLMDHLMGNRKTEEARSESKRKVDAREESRLQGKKDGRDKEEGEVLPPTKRPKSEREATATYSVQVGEKGAREVDRRQREIGSIRKSVADDINQAKRGVADSGGEKFDKRTYVTKKGNGGGGSGLHHPQTPSSYKRPTNATSSAATTAVYKRPEFDGRGGVVSQRNRHGPDGGAKKAPRNSNFSTGVPATYQSKSAEFTPAEKPLGRQHDWTREDRILRCGPEPLSIFGVAAFFFCVS